MRKVFRNLRLTAGVFLLVTILGCTDAAVNKTDKMEVFQLTRSEVIEKTLKPYTGPSVKGVDTSTLEGKVLCGYQGWFACPGDGSGRGWFHWGDSENGKYMAFKPGACSIDLWPDMSEFDDDEKYPTAFKHADGSTAYVYSPMNAKSVGRHYKWMKDYGIDGTFVQRFSGEVRYTKFMHHYNTVLANCRAGANKYGRTYAIMYDLSSPSTGEIPMLIEDWKMLVDNMRLTKDPADKAYLHHNGKPVVAIWGVGFYFTKTYTLEDCERLIDFFKNDKEYGGCTVILGVPTYWRTLVNDSVTDPKLHEVILKADIVSPWMVGRFTKPEEFDKFARIWADDIKWCNEHDKEYMAVMWPGFSWANLQHNPDKVGEISRLGGRLLWKQYVDGKKVGVNMVYQAMFDEMDEGTAIFKCTNNPPVGASKFLTYEPLPSDHYLWLVGQGTKVIRGEIEPTDELPIREP